MKKMFIIRRKNIVVGMLVALLIVAGYLNFVYNQNSTPTVNPKDSLPSLEENGADQGANQNPDAEKEEITGGVEDVSGGIITVSDLEEPEESSRKDSLDTVAAVAAGTFFRDYRFEREQRRKEEVAYINSIVDNPNSDVDMVKEAQVQLLEITSNMESELVIENLIKAKGMKDTIVIIHRDNVNVIVDKSELVPEEVAMILDIVKRESGKEIENIKIIPKI